MPERFDETVEERVTRMASAEDHRKRYGTKQCMAMMQKFVCVRILFVLLRLAFVGGMKGDERICSSFVIVVV